MSPRRAAPAAGEPAAPVAGEPPAAAPADRGSHPVVLVAQAPEDRLDRFLAASGRLPSRVVATRLIREGQVEVNGRPARASRALVAGDRVSFVAPPPAPSDLEPEAMALSVLYED
ncbi:MAG TPA: S4 domain-containing protein, partial [Candidatus Dormibacteraeota bacterium]|nr:S4 domain-containing protein [Candidatus Dormibacteraeota bacterium]